MNDKVAVAIAGVFYSDTNNGRGVHWYKTCFNLHSCLQISGLFGRTDPVQMLLLFTDKCVSW